MVWLIRWGMYFIGGFAAWQALQGAEPAGGILSGKALVLDSANGMIFGVCSGLSNYTGLDVTVIRLVWTATAFYRGLGIVMYILAFLIMPVMIDR